MRADFLGCRGSTPVEGPAFETYGGSTSSVQVSAGDSRVLLDAGTGIRHLHALEAGPFRGSVFLSHLHWDHVQGLPFCSPLDHPHARVDLHLPAQPPGAERLMARLMSPPLFPIRPEELRGDWRFLDAEPGRFEEGSLTVSAFEVPHKGGRTYGYRVEDGARSLVYISDHAPGPPGSGPDGLGEMTSDLLSVVEGADLLIHDAQFLDEEYPERAFLGHSAIGYAVALGEKAGVAEVILFHHDPARTDAALDAIAAELPPGVSLARQGMRW